jgi:hypothetical protein
MPAITFDRAEKRLDGGFRSVENMNELAVAIG